MENETQIINRVNALQQEQRDAAYDAARKRIAGKKPEAPPAPLRSAYSEPGNVRFPAWVSWIVTALCVAMLLAAFLPSAMRLHAVALRTNKPVMVDVPSVYVAALATVIMAEIGQVIFSLAAAVNPSWLQKFFLFCGALICTLIALSGNAVAMSVHALTNIFAFLETFAPPVLVLITAQILKTQMLHATEANHTANLKFEEAKAEWTKTSNTALSAWNAAYAAASSHPDWEDTLANAIRDALRTANRQSKAVLRGLSNADWRALVIRERSAEEWWKVAEQQANAEAERMRHEAEQQAALETRLRVRSVDAPNGLRSTGSTGEVANAELKRNGELYVRVCPNCGREFEGATKRAATNSLVAHMKSHAHKQRALEAVPTQDDDTEPVEVTVGT